MKNLSIFPYPKTQRNLKNSLPTLEILQPHLFFLSVLSAVSVDLELLEKPRGSNGQWIPLHAQQYVRVSSKKGKNLRLVARANPITSLKWAQARLFAVENTAAGVQRKHEPSETSTHFQIIDSRWSEGYAEFDLKIFFKNNTVHFVVEMPEHGIRAASGAIITHNSGHIDHAGKKAAAAAAAAAATKPSTPPAPPARPTYASTSPPPPQTVPVVIKQEPIFARDSDESMDGTISLFILSDSLFLSSVSYLIMAY
jgi:hypothetical protein